MKQQFKEYLIGLDKELHEQSKKENLSPKEKRKLAYEKFKAGHLRGYHELRSIIINRYRITQGDLDEIKKENRRESNKYYRKEMGDYWKKYREENKDKLLAYDKEYQSKPSYKEKRKLREKEMRRVYREYRRRNLDWQ